MIAEHFHLEPIGISPGQLLAYGFERSDGLLRLGRSAPRGDQTGLAERCAGLAAAQTGRVEVGPDLLRAIWDDGPDIEPVCLGEGNHFARFHLGRKTGQSDDSRA
jgi:hypothetical protein